MKERAIYDNSSRWESKTEVPVIPRKPGSIHGCVRLGI